MQMSKTHVNSAQGFLITYLKGRGPLRKLSNAVTHASAFSLFMGQPGLV